MPFELPLKIELNTIQNKLTIEPKGLLKPSIQYNITGLDIFSDLKKICFSQFFKDGWRSLKFSPDNFLDRFEALELKNYWAPSSSLKGFLNLFNNLKEFTWASPHWFNDTDFQSFHDELKKFLETKKIKIFNYISASYKQTKFLSTNLLPNLPASTEELHFAFDKFLSSDNPNDSFPLCEAFLIGLLSSNSIKIISLNMPIKSNIYLPALVEVCKKPYTSISLETVYSSIGSIDNLLCALAKNLTLKSLKLNFIIDSDPNLDKIIFSTIKAFADTTVEDLNLNFKNTSKIKLDATLINSLISEIQKIKPLRQLDLSNFISPDLIPAFSPLLINSKLQKLSFFTDYPEKVSQNAAKEALDKFINFHRDNKSNLIEFDLIEKILADQALSDLHLLAKRAKCILDLNKAKLNILVKPKFKEAPSLFDATTFFISRNDQARESFFKNITIIPDAIVEGTLKSLTQESSAENFDSPENDHEPPKKQLRTV